MAIRPIRVIGDPVLRMPCKEVESVNKGIENLIKDMAETMYDAPGIGLAAPQIGVAKRVIVFDTGEGLQVLLNPSVQEKGEDVEGKEGCLSVPGRERLIERPAHILLEAMDMDGKWSTYTFEGLEARVVLHEIDHLEGRLIVDQGRGVPEEEAATQ